jgi:cellobiose-specific phosphotransferase system component IIA
LIVTIVGVLIVAAVFLSTQLGSGRDALTEAVEGGELALTSVGRNYESLTHFVQSNETESKQLLEAAKTALETSKAKLNSAKQTDDEYVRNMVNNYQSVAQASDVMAHGMDSLLTVSDNLTLAINFYSQKNFENASEQASYCLEVLAPLQSDFQASDSALKGIIISYVPSGQRDRLAHGVDQYQNEMTIYNQIVLFLRSIIEGKDYLQMNAQLEEDTQELQSAIANEDFERAEGLLQKMSEALQTLRSPGYQNAADLASQLNPNSLSGDASAISQELKNRLRDQEGLDSFGNYLQSLQKYLEALELFKQGKSTDAEQAINEGLRLLGEGTRSDSELEGMYEGLRDAYNTLRLHIKGQPDQG